MKNKEFIEFEELSFNGEKDVIRKCLIRKSSIYKVTQSYKDTPESSFIFVENGHPVMVRMTVPEIMELL